MINTKTCSAIKSLLFCTFLLLFQKPYAQSVVLDNSFGLGGISTLDVGNIEEYGESVALQSDGKIILAGWDDEGINRNFVITRFDSDGELDLTFGNNGITVVDFAGSHDVCLSVEVQTDGKIVASGYSLVLTNYDIALCRLTEDGLLDITFNATGKVTTAVGTGSDFSRDLALQSDGKIIVGGLTDNSGNSDFVVVRYNSDGSLDNSFDTDGIAVTEPGLSDDVIESIAIQADGKILAAGQSFNGSTSDFCVVRYNSDGSLDPTFDSDGIVITEHFTGPNNIFSIKIQPDGKIVAAGFSMTAPGENSHFSAVRYNHDGSLDPLFGTAGKIFTPVCAISDRSNALVIGSDGTILLAGFAYNTSNRDFALVRYLANGTIDNSFDSDGILLTPIGDSTDVISDLIVQPDGKILAVGLSHNGVDSDLALARYIVDFSGWTEEEHKKNPLVYPNPASNDFSIRTETLFTNASLKILDCAGTIIYYETDLSGNIFSIDLSNQPNGIYFIEICDEGQFNTAKIIKL